MKRQYKPRARPIDWTREMQEAREARELRRLIRKEREMRQRELLRAQIEQMRWRA